MELPKNITQIGEADPRCKIYIEDYVISYLKQVNRKLDGKKIGLTLYGVCKEENDIRYYFFYGAAPNPFLTSGTKYLSQAVLQEAEKQRKRFFAEYAFLGYMIPDGGMPENIYLYEQGIATEMFGYARFYEQNDSMLNFLLAEQKETESATENVANDKFDEVRKRREARKQQVVEEKKDKPGSKAAERIVPAAACLMLLLLGMSTDAGKAFVDKLQQRAIDGLEQLQEKQLPVSGQAESDSRTAGKVVTEDRLTEALQKENNAYATASAKVEAESEPAEETASVSSAEEEEPLEETAAVILPSPTPEPTPEPTPSPTPEVQETGTRAVAAHVVKKGDTLMGISWKYYGTGEQLENICKYNNIKDPNDIKVGQKILLP